jgi:hypothetical protein
LRNSAYSKNLRSARVGASFAFRGHDDGQHIVSGD